MSYTEEKNLMQLGIIVLGGLVGISGAIIGLIQNRKIIKESKGEWNASGSNSRNKSHYLSVLYIISKLWKP